MVGAGAVSTCTTIALIIAVCVNAEYRQYSVCQASTDGAHGGLSMNTEQTTIPAVRARWLALRDELRQMRQNESLRRSVEARADLCRMGVAMAFSHELPRNTVVRIADQANRRHYLHNRIFRELDIREPFDMEGREHLDAALLAGQGAIIVPAHFGRYRSIPQALFDIGLSVTLLVDAPNTTVLSSMVQMDAWQQSFVGTGPESFAVVSSRDVCSLWSLARALAAGRVVIAFADGNSGINGYAHDRGSIYLPFLSRTISARTGIAALAVHANVPMIPVRARERAGRPPLLCFYPPIRAENHEDKTTFRERGTRALYKWLEKCIRESPSHWEEWSTFTRWVIPTSLVNETRMAPVLVPQALPALAGKFLTIAGPYYWVSSTRGTRAVFDVERLQCVSDDQHMVDLVLAAESGTGALEWANRYANSAFALDVLARAIAGGIVTLTRRGIA